MTTSGVVSWFCLLVLFLCYDVTSAGWFSSDFSCPNGGCDVRSDTTFSCIDLNCTTIPKTLEGKTVTSIVMTNNRIENITALDYPDLDILDLSDNLIYTIPGGVLYKLHQLTLLRLSRNKLTAISLNYFSGLDNLKTLYLNGNDITEIYGGSFMSLERTLLRLDISSNHIFRIEDSAFNRLENLRFLNLQNNRIITLGYAAFQGLPNVQNIDLSGNNLQEVSSNQFMACNNLKYLTLSYNNISTLYRDSFIGPRSLETLDLHSNQLLDIPNKTLSSLVNLRTVYLDRNPLVVLEGPIFPVSLNHVTIKHMPALVTIADGVFANKPYLRIVTISNNNLLYHISPHAFDGDESTLVELDLSGNALTRLDESMVNWQKLQVLDLTDNPWDCSCALKWLHDDVYADYNSRTNILCTTPKQLKGVRLQDVDSEDFGCGGSLLNRYRRAIAFILLILVMIALFLFVFIIVQRRNKRPLCGCCKKFGTQKEGYDVMYSSQEDEYEYDDDVTGAVTMVNEKKKLKIHSSSTDPAPTPV